MKNNRNYKDPDVRSVYERMIDTLFYSKPMENLNAIFHEDFIGYGRESPGLLLNFKDLIETVHIHKNRHRKHPLEITRKPIFGKSLQDGAVYLILEEFQVFDHDNDSRYTSRISTILERIGEKWLITHFHASTSGFNIALEYHPPEALPDKYLELEKQIKEQTRELEIEEALEKVRFRAMSMNTAGELKEVARELRTQLGNLGQRDLETCAIHLYEESPDFFQSWAAVRPPQFNGKIIESEVKLPKKGTQLINEMLESYFSNQQDYVLFAEGEKATEWFTLLKMHFPEIVDLIIEYREGIEGNRDSGYYFSFSDFPGGSLVLVTYTTPNDDFRSLLRRFADVFGLAYQRFREIKQAEEQTREARIEAALERVRSSAMAMQTSDDLNMLIGKVFTECTKLDIELDRGIIVIYNPQSLDSTLWMANPEAPNLPRCFYLHYHDHPPYLAIIQAWKERRKKWIYELKGELKKNWDAYIFKQTEMTHLPNEVKKTMMGFQKVFLNCSFNNFGCLTLATLEPMSESNFQILLRFAKVFDLTYTRFNDLKLAEAQAREAKIETALERVRSQTMAMHKSEDLLKIITVVSHQLEHLNFKFNTVSFAVNNQVHDYKFWFAIPGDPNPVYIQVPYIQNPMFDRMKKVLAEEREFYTDTLTPEESRAWHEHVFAHSHIPAMTEETKAYILRSGYARSIAIMPRIMLILSNYAGKPYSEDENEIIKRFAGVFEQSYTRFLDLQKAESQAREAEIEASLERVRAKAMAMHSSKDIEFATAVVFNELSRLGIDMERCGITLLNETSIAELWSTPLSQESKEVVNVVTGYLDFGIHPMLQQSYQDWREKKDFTIYKLVGDEVKKYYAILEKQPQYKFPKVAHYPEQQILNTFYFKEGGIFAFTVDELSAESKDIIQKFTKVFAQTYTRFLDIQKAEAQAREAQIEAALERVRGSAMAMQTSDDLNMLIGKVFTECTKLDIELDRGIIMIYNPESLDSTWWMANPEAPNLPRCFYLHYHDHPPYLAIIQAWKESRKKWIYELKGELKKNWDAYIFKQTELAQLPNEVKKTMTGFQKVFLNCSFNNFGCLTLATLEPMAESNFQILLRFAKVFDLTYTRFNDLKLAEAQAREAKIETALERIRAKALAMHQSNECMEVALTLREQMGLLGQKELEASVIQFYNLKKETMHSWHVLNTPGTVRGDFSAGSFEMRKDTCRLTQQFFKHFQSEKTEYTIVVEGEELREWLEYLKSVSPEVNETFQGLEQEPERAYYYFSKFSEGALLMVTSVPATEESRYLQRRAAQVFELAYQRYKDLKQAEKLAKKAEQDFILLKEEKKRTDEALRELTTTQAQLIHAEKMASLGQLTAGIAHEIQNPLNFVNNFSEVSAELIEEIEEERAKTQDARDENLVSEILGDIKENIQKINHHGKRADSIVKGMLEHSRTTTGEKALTDINTLADEYLRLSYHGMRAKDKNFQADFKTHFDPNLPKVNVVPQDFGRVLLNIVNNAFQACGNSDLRFQKPDFKPLVTVSTKHKGDQIEISISDNGPGIPDEIKDKIFQPFFTTKPTGQGTGLGLSLSYDIVKAHGGELKVETRTGIGSIFRIQIPINN